MDKIDSFFTRFFNFLDAVIVLGGGALGGYLAWTFMGFSETALMMRLGGTALTALIFMVVTALIWRLFTFLNS